MFDGECRQVAIRDQVPGQTVLDDERSEDVGVALQDASDSFA